MNFIEVTRAFEHCRGKVIESIVMGPEPRCITVTFTSRNIAGYKEGFVVEAGFAPAGFIALLVGDLPKEEALRPDDRRGTHSGG
jgi:hypothetical protein